MNNHAEYRRHSHQPPVQVPSAEDGEAVSQLAHRADPSLPTTQQPPQSSRRVAWVRPTELANFTGPLIGRGIDLQAELIRRARRAPVQATRAVRRHIHHSTQERPAPREEGIAL